MKKNEYATKIDKHLSQFDEESPLVQWLSQNGLNALIALIALIAVVLLGYRLFYGGSSQQEMEYFNAENDFQLFNQGKIADTGTASNDEAFTKLQKILKSLPELNAKYDGLIAQTFLNREEISQAEPYANSTLVRIHDNHLPFYAEYAETTLLISQQKYQDALTKANGLKLKMLENAKISENQHQDRTFGDILFAFNLLRIAMLEQQMGTKKDELKTWQEFKQFAKWNGEPSPSTLISPKAFQTLLEHFQEGKVTLLNYIEAREKILKPS